jgi:hypothetical protein
MVAIGDQSYVVGGLDRWKDDPRATIYEPRLQDRLKANRFQLPPAAATPPAGAGVAVRRFPEFYSCPECNELQEFHKFGSPSGTSRCNDCGWQLTPSRFVIACENGHLDDFPYFDWVHKKTSPVDTSTGGKHRLTLHSTGQTASLRSVVIRCTCNKEASLEGAFGRRALQALGISCRGRRPWLGRDTDEPGCIAVPRTLQRGSSAAWFPVNESALSIPPWSQTLQKRINQHYLAFRAVLDSGVDRSVLVEVVKSSGVLNGTSFSVDDVVAAVERRRELEASAGPDSDDQIEFEPADGLRRPEYEQLLFGTPNVDRGEDFECIEPTTDPAFPLPQEIDKVMQVKRLREVRALRSFTRVEMPGLMDSAARLCAMSQSDIDWLPAIEVSGEGVFLTLDQARLAEWETRGGPADRSARIASRHTTLLRERANAAQPRGPIEGIVSPITARYVMLHTLAHALINEWSLESGYPAAALRERLYVAGNMAGVLIYTATSDSAGSLGGVVAQGEYRRLRASLESALGRIRWCSQDPPCMESEASGAGGLNLAACYACVLLPETSCEVNNTFLDRAMLIGTPDDPSIGFFAAHA